MSSSSGNSNSSSSKSSEHDLAPHVNMTDQRKRKRKESNRESVRRSRMRKQQHLNELASRVTQLSRENYQILTSIDFTTHHYMNVQAENSILRARMMELSQRLDSLNEILNYLNTTSNNGLVYETDQFFATNAESFANPLPYLNQAIMASADIDQY